MNFLVYQVSELRMQVMLAVSASPKNTLFKPFSLLFQFYPSNMNKLVIKISLIHCFQLFSNSSFKGSMGLVVQCDFEGGGSAILSQVPLICLPPLLLSLLSLALSLSLSLTHSLYLNLSVSPFLFVL